MKKLQFYLLLIIYTWLGVARTDSLPIPTFNDLLMHFSGYVILMNSCLFAYGTRPSKAAMFSLLLLYSFGIEVIQYFIPYRDFSLLDLVANGLGLIIGQIIGLTALRLTERYRTLTQADGKEAGDNTIDID